MGNKELLEQYRQLILEQVHTLASVRLEGMDWYTVKDSSLLEIVHMAYVQGAEDALRQLGHLLDGLNPIDPSAKA